MSTIHQEMEALTTRAWPESRMVYVGLTDQRGVGFPADRFRRLKETSAVELAEVRLKVGDTALRWESLDEDNSVEGAVAGGSSCSGAESISYRCMWPAAE